MRRYVVGIAAPDPLDDQPDAVTGAVVEANRRFYDAFERRDLDAMSEVWEHSDRVLCTHPGWPALRGWGAVAGSWYALFRGPQVLQFILTELRVQVAGDTAWVTVDENLISGEVGGTVSAVNLFVRDGGRWKLVVHHASGVSPVVGAAAGLDDDQDDGD